MTTQNQLREALDNLQSATSWALGHIWSANYADRCREARRRVNDAFDAVYAALAQPAVGGEPLFILHCGQIDSSGEQDEWEAEANGQQRVDDFCRLHPGQKIKLYPAPPASQEQAQPKPQPMTEEQIDVVIEKAYQSLRKHKTRIRGQTVTQFDGIEAHIIRETEAHHGITSTKEA